MTRRWLLIRLANLSNCAAGRRSASSAKAGWSSSCRQFAAAEVGRPGAQPGTGFRWAGHAIDRPRSRRDFVAQRRPARTASTPGSAHPTQPPRCAPSDEPRARCTAPAQERFASWRPCAPSTAHRPASVRGQRALSVDCRVDGLPRRREYGEDGISSLETSVPSLAEIAASSRGSAGRAPREAVAEPSGEAGRASMSVIRKQTVPVGSAYVPTIPMIRAMSVDGGASPSQQEPATRGFLRRPARILTTSSGTATTLAPPCSIAIGEWSAMSSPPIRCGGAHRG